MDVSVVIVSYNVAELLKNCLQSIFKYTSGLTFEVIVVDNASTDDSVEILKSFQQNNFKLIESPENGGFSKGNNLGISQAKGKYILLLNPDTLLVENTVKAMFDWMEAHQDYAVASCQLLDSEQNITSTGGYFPTLPKVAAWAFFLDDILKLPSYHPEMGPFHKNKTVYQKEFDPDWVTGAFFMVRAEATKKAGVLDEEFFLYGEELEWCMRFKQMDWKVGYTPVTKIVHLERKSSGGLPKNAVLGEFRGLKYIYAKHFPGWRQSILEFLLNIAAFLRIIFWLIRLKPEMAKVYFEALWTL